MAAVFDFQGRLWPESKSSLLARPRAQSQPDDPQQLRAAGSARRLHRHPANDNHDLAREVGGVRVGRQITLRFRARESASQRGFARRANRDGQDRQNGKSFQFPIFSFQFWESKFQI